MKMRNERNNFYPMMPGMNGYPMGMPIIGDQTTFAYETMNTVSPDDLSRLNTQIANLDRRVSRLESIVENKTTNPGTTNYSTETNYHIM